MNFGFNLPMNIANNQQKALEVPPHASIWDIPSKYHLSILGLCLTENEQLRLATGTVVLKPGPYCRIKNLSGIAEAIPDRSRKSCELQEILDRKFRLSLVRFGNVKTKEDLEKLWNTSLEGGEIRGAYWSLMTHILASLELQEKVYQQLNIFSLENCCSHMQERKRTCGLETKLLSKDEAFAVREQQLNTSICHYCSQISELKTELFLAEHKVRKMERTLELVTYRNRILKND
jgi:hypothetical protein